MLSRLPPELILRIASLLTRETIVDPQERLVGPVSRKPALVPDLPSISALSRTNSAFHRTLNQILYELCASVPDIGKLALLFAVEHQLESTFDKLVAAGIGSHQDLYFDFGTCSILHIAARSGLRVMVVKLLEMYGEEMAARVHPREDNGFTALDYAARTRHLDIVKILAPIALPIPHVSGIPPAAYEIQERYLSIALVQAAQDGNQEICRYLVSEGADVNFLDERIYPGTALFFAARTNLALVQFLLESGADPNLHVFYVSPPLFRATNVEITKALVSAGADIDAKDSESRNLLVSHFGDVEIYRFALERGVDPNNIDNFGWTPLHYACNMMPKFAIPLVKELLQFGAVTVEEVENREGLTPVEFAMRYASSELVRMLEPLVQDPNSKLKVATWLKEREDRSWRR